MNEHCPIRAGAAMESTAALVLRRSFPGPRHEGVVLVLEGYFDDSGTHGDARVVVWGGFVGTVDQWIGLDARWRQKLNEPLPGKPRLKKFGLGDCRWGAPPFDTYSYAERDLLQAEFRQIIVDAGVIGLAHSADRAAYDRLMTDDARKFFGDAEMMCFGECFSSAIQVARAEYPDHTELALHFDIGRLSTKLSSIVDIVNRNYSGVPDIKSVGFDKVVDFTPLQAADIVATEHYWDTLAFLSDGERREHFRHFLKNVNTTGYVLDHTALKVTLKAHDFPLSR